MADECCTTTVTNTITLSRGEWMRARNKGQPIFSRYYRWVVDGSNTGGKVFNKSQQVGYTDINYMEIGHFESHDFKNGQRIPKQHLMIFIRTEL